MTLEILPCRRSHLRAVWHRLRPEECLEFQSLEVKPRHALIAQWLRSDYSQAAVLDGEPIAVWGDAAGLLDREGLFWIATTAGVERCKIAFLKIGRSELRRLLEVRLSLATTVHRSCGRALRLARHVADLQPEIGWLGVLTAVHGAARITDSFLVEAMMAAVVDWYAALDRPYSREPK